MSYKIPENKPHIACFLLLFLAGKVKMYLWTWRYPWLNRDTVLLVQVSGPGDGFGLWCRLGVYSRDATRWRLGGPLVQEADKRTSLSADRDACQHRLITRACFTDSFLFLLINISAKSPRFSSECDHCGWRCDVQRWQTHYIWPDQKGKPFLIMSVRGKCCSSKDTVTN